MLLTPAQKKVWNVLVRTSRKLGALPAPAAVARELKLSETRIKQHLGTLELKGLLEVRSLGAGRTPALAFTLSGRAEAGLVVPVAGVIRGGPLSEAMPEVVGYLELPGKPGRFALRVTGDSMADRVLDGDIVILQANLEPAQGEMCAVRVNGHEATLKYLYRDVRRKKALLEAQNREYDSIQVPLSEVYVDGVYQGLLRGRLEGLFKEVNV